MKADYWTTHQGHHVYVETDGERIRSLGDFPEAGIRDEEDVTSVLDESEDLMSRHLASEEARFNYDIAERYRRRRVW